MGWAVLYIAFGIVALWLLGEVLLQYKARLRWRLLAFAGFLGVVLGVLMPSVVVIGVGAIAFAIGQTYVTLSFRRGFAAGWAVRQPGADGTGTKRRRGRADHQDPGPEGADLEAADDAEDEAAALDAAADPPGQDGSSYGRDDDEHDDVFTPAQPAGPAAADTGSVYAPQPLPDDTGSYGVYGDPAYQAAQGQDQGRTQDPYATAGQDYGYDYAGYGQQGYGYDTTGGQQYTGYQDPYAGSPAYDAGASYDTGYGNRQGYVQQDYGTQDPYAAGGYQGQTPAGGVWVPQQRGEDTFGGRLGPEQQGYPYPDDGQGQAGREQSQGQAQHGAGFDEQYRY